MQGEGNVLPEYSTEHVVAVEYSGTAGENANMFAELGDDENDDTVRPLFQLKPSLLSVPLLSRRDEQKRQEDVSSDDDEDL